MTETKMPIHEILKVLQFHASCSQKCVKICILQRNAFVLNNMYKKNQINCHSAKMHGNKNFNVELTRH